MRVIHVTLTRHLDSIMSGGLDPTKAIGRRKAVWAVSPGMKLWATLHVCTRHRVLPEQTVVLHLNIPDKWVRRHPGRLMWIPQVIPPDRIVNVESLVRELRNGDNA